ncbi:MAG TPA: hypothetical protein VGP64_11120 [Polyangia bacterium]
MQKRAFIWGAIVGAGLIGVGCADEGAPAPNVPVTSGAALPVTAAAKSRPIELFVPPPDSAAVSQIAGLIRQRDLGDALKLTALEATPRAVWFTSGTPSDVQRAVRKTMDEAALEGRVPVLTPAATDAGRSRPLPTRRRPTTSPPA